MKAHPLTLTGPWMGRYSYVTQVKPPVAFNAVITDEDGNLSGETIEPNSFSDIDLDTLIAGLIGVREGSMVRWSKTYSDFDASKIDYDGTANATFTRIEGRWSFPAAPWQHGTFVLIRDTVAVSQGVRRSKRAPATLANAWDRQNQND